MTTPSDTPLTDAELAKWFVKEHTYGQVYDSLVVHARTLEREVNRLKKELEEAEITLEAWQCAAQYPEG